MNDVDKNRDFVLVKRPSSVVEKVTPAAIFLGNYSLTMLGDYVAGPSHTLPTGGAGASFPGLTVDQLPPKPPLCALVRSSYLQHCCGFFS